MSGLAALAPYRSLVDRTLARVLPAARIAPPMLHEAMRYSTLAPAKRLRPCMTILAGECFGASPAELAGPAAALELIHTYSLIHDDLPCMDDDDLRRGRPTCHVKFGESTAVLAGDALLTMAFEVLAREALRSGFPAHRTLAGVVEVASAAGSRGLVAGQIEDLAAEGRTVSLARLANIHARKTGCLFTAALRLGAILAGAGWADLSLLTRYGRLFGQVFQMTDDILNVVGTEDVLGKAVGSDEEHHKATYPGLMGLEACRALARRRADAAATLIERLAARLDRRSSAAGAARAGGARTGRPPARAHPRSAGEGAHGKDAPAASALLAMLVRALPERKH